MFQIFKHAFIRKCAYLLASALLTFFVSSTDIFAAVSEYRFQNQTTGFLTPQEVCTNVASNLIYHQYEGENQTPTNTANATGFCRTASFDNIGLVYYYYVQPPQCTPPEVLNTVTNTCESPNECLPLKGILTKGHFNSGLMLSQFCKNNCTVLVRDSVCTPDFCSADGRFTGSSCTPTQPATIPPSPEHECISKGMSYGYVNSVVVCTKSGSNGTPPVTTKTANQTTSTTDGQTTTTDQTKTTDSASGKTTTTTTTTNHNGTTTTTQQEQDTTDFCEQNPNTKMCAPNDDLCEKHPDIPACKAWCDKPENADKLSCMEKGETTIAEEITNNEISLNFSTVSGIPSAIGCPTPDTVNIAGHSIPLSYEWLCMYASAFKYLVLIFSWLSAAYIVSAAVNERS